jgi:DNA invertase Pin-like site-specific DNA recombinase
MLTVFGAIAELERDNTLQRQREGIAIAKEKGLYKGKPKMEIDREKFEKAVAEWKAGKMTATQCMTIVGLKPNTFYRRVKEWAL